MGSDRTVAEDKGTSDRTGSLDEERSERSAIIAIISNERSERSAINAITDVLAGFPMSIYAEHCSPLGAPCSTFLTICYMR